MKLYYHPQSGRIKSEKQEVLLSRQSNLCLIHLCENAGTIVSKEALLDACWTQNGVIVSEGTVRQTMFRLRKSLALLEPEKNILETRGYAGYLLIKGAIEVVDRQEDIPLNTITSGVDERNSADSGRNSTTGITWMITMNYIVITCVLIVLMISIGAIQRSRQMIHPLEYGGETINNGRSYYFSGLVPKVDEAAIHHADYWLNKANMVNSDYDRVYLNATHGNTMNFFSCNGEITKKNTRCVSFSVIGANQK